MSRHTQGPWSIIPGTLGITGPKAPDPTTRARYAALATVHTFESANPTWEWPTLEESKANAHLIAAAPELLEALKLAEATIERLSPARPYDHTQGSRDVIRAAIAKAEGGAK